MKLTKKDLEWAADKDLLRAEQIEPLWDALKRKNANTPSFNFINLAYYFGTGLVLVAMGWYLAISWDKIGAAGILTVALSYSLLFLFSAHYLWYRKNMRIPGGLLCTLSVCMVPLMVYSFMRMTGLWPADDFHNNYMMLFGTYKRNYIILELSTIVASAVALRFFRFPFLTAPMAYCLWALSLDVASLISGKEIFQSGTRDYITLIIGLAILAVAYIVDLRRKDDRDFAFWLYLFGSFSTFIGFANMHKANETAELGFAGVYVLIMLVSVLIQRKTVLIASVLLILGYIFHIANHFFRDSQSFPLILSFIGIAIIVLGIALQKNWHTIQSAVRSVFPAEWNKFLPERDD